MEEAAPHLDERWPMPDAFHVPDADVRCSSARAVIADKQADRAVPSRNLDQFLTNTKPSVPCAWK